MSGNDDPLLPCRILKSTCCARCRSSAGSARVHWKRYLLKAELVTVSAGEYFFREGDPGGMLFILRAGSVVVERQWNGKTVMLGRLATGDCFGEMALVDFQPRSASVRATDDCEALCLSLNALRSLYENDVEQYAMIMMNMGREVSRRLRSAGDRILELQYRA